MIRIDAVIITHLLKESLEKLKGRREIIAVFQAVTVHQRTIFLHLYAMKCGASNFQTVNMKNVKKTCEML
jgi:hypothetical protein